MVNDAIKWEAYSKAGNPEVDDATIEYIEQRICHKLPVDYLKIAKTENGKRPIPGDIDVGKRSTVFTCLLTLRKDDDPSNNSLLASFKNNDDRGDDIVPFALAGGGSRFCFDYRQNKDNPIVVFDNSDFEIEDSRAIVYVANSFTALLEKLYAE